MIGNRSFWSKLKAQPTVGVLLQSASPLVANSMSAAGFDWLVIDPINSPLSQLESFAMQTAVGDGNPTPVLMRVGGPTDRSGIQQATDTGAAGILVPNVRSAEDIAKARRPTRFPPVGDRSLYGPLRAHHKEGVVVHMLQSDRNFVVAIQIEKAPVESWEHLLAEDFHVAVLDIPQLCVELGLYDALLAAPPAGDGTLPSRLKPWLQVYQQPCAELAGLVTRFGELCTKHGKVAGVLLGEHSAAPLYQSLGIQFIGIGSDLIGDDGACRGSHRAAAGQHVRMIGRPAPLNCAVDKTRSDAFWDLLRLNAPFAGSILTDGGYEAMRAVRPAPVVLIDCFREGLNTPTALSRALRSLDGTGHRLVRIISADPKDTPMTAAVALALGADSVVVPVCNAAEARAVKAACSYKGGSRTLNIGPELPYHVAKVPAAGIELLSVPPTELAEMIAAADFVMASTANFFLAEGREQALASLVSLQEACRSQGKSFFLLDDALPSVELIGGLAPPIRSANSRRHRSQRARTRISRRRTRGWLTSNARCAEAPSRLAKSCVPQAPRSRPRTSRPEWIGFGSSGSTRARTPLRFARKWLRSPSAAVSPLPERRGRTTRPASSNASMPASIWFWCRTSIPWRRRSNRSGTACSRHRATACGTAAHSRAQRSRP